MPVFAEKQKSMFCFSILCHNFFVRNKDEGAALFLLGILRDLFFGVQRHANAKRPVVDLTKSLSENSAF